MDCDVYEKLTHIKDMNLSFFDQGTV